MSNTFIVPRSRYFAPWAYPRPIRRRIMPIGPNAPKGDARLTWIVLDKMRLEAGVDVDAWGRPRSMQPVVLSVQVLYDFRKAAEDDDFTHTLDYSKLNTDIRKAAASAVAVTPFNLWSAIVALMNPCPQSKAWGVKLTLALPKALLNSEDGITYKFHLQREGDGPDLQSTPFYRCNTVSINELRVQCIIGVKDRERSVRQTIFITIGFKVNHKELEFDPTGENSQAQPPPLPYNWKQIIAQKVFETMSNTSFLTVERAALEVERIVRTTIDDIWTDNERLRGLEKLQLSSLSVKKPSALPGVEGSGVTLEYTTTHDDSQNTNFF